MGQNSTFSYVKEEIKKLQKNFKVLSELEQNILNNQPDNMFKNYPRKVAETVQPASKNENEINYLFKNPSIKNLISGNAT